MPRSRRTLTPDAILEAAIPLFHERGYRNTTLEEVAAVLGVTRPALYNHFQSKEEILLEIMHRVMQQTLLKVREAMAKDLPVEVKFIQLLTYQIEIIASHRDIIGVFYDELERIDQQKIGTVTSMIGEYGRSLEELYRQGVAAGQFMDVDPAVAVRTLFGAANWVNRWYRPGGRYDPRTLAEEMCRLLMNGFWRRSRLEAAAGNDGRD